MATEPTIEEVAAAKERLAHPTRISGDGWHEYLTYDDDDVRTLLASHASLEESRKDAGGISADLARYAAQLDRMTVAASFGGDDLGVRVKDPGYLSKLLHEASRALAAFVNEKET